MTKHLLLAGILSAAALHGQAPAETLPVFDAASLKPIAAPAGRQMGGGFTGSVTFQPGRATSRMITVRGLIMSAYHVTSYQLSGAPGWLDADHFSLEAKAAGPANEAELRRMLQTLLSDRCQLILHHETRELPVYELKVGRNGTTMPEWKPDQPMPGYTARRASGPLVGSMSDRGTMQYFADSFSGQSSIGRPVLDKTGLTGTYILMLSWYADEEFIDAVQEVTGLKFEPKKSPVDTLVIDRVEKPSGN